MVMVFNWGPFIFKRGPIEGESDDSNSGIDFVRHCRRLEPVESRRLRDGDPSTAQLC